MKHASHLVGTPQAVSARRGTSSLELVVAFSLLVTAMASTLPLYVRQQRLVSESRRERVAIEELANLAERLEAGGSGALESLSPSATAVRKLPGVELTTAQDQTSLGTRVVLSLNWNETGRREIPVQLAVWLLSPSGDPSSPQSEVSP